MQQIRRGQPDCGKRAVVCGAGGFIGSHLVKRLKREGYWVRGVDLKEGIALTYPWVEQPVLAAELKK
jgi:nucleoside-diphosphate-sugar epimerase